MPDTSTGQKAAGRGCLALLVLAVLIVLLGAIVGDPDQERDDAVLAELDRTYGTRPGCLAGAKNGNWREAALVLDSQSTDELVIVEVYLRRTLTGEEVTYRFGVPVGPDGRPQGGVLPGNEAARAC